MHLCTQTFCFLKTGYKFESKLLFREYWLFISVYLDDFIQLSSRTNSVFYVASAVQNVQSETYVVSVANFFLAECGTPLVMFVLIWVQGFPEDRWGKLRTTRAHHFCSLSNIFHENVHRILFRSSISAHTTRRMVNTGVLYPIRSTTRDQLGYSAIHYFDLDTTGGTIHYLQVLNKWRHNKIPYTSIIKCWVLTAVRKVKNPQKRYRRRWRIIIQLELTFYDMY